MQTNLSKQELLDELKYYQDARELVETHLLEVAEDGRSPYDDEHHLIAYYMRRESIILKLLEDQYEKEKLDMLSGHVKAVMGI